MRSSRKKATQKLPLVALRGLLVFPQMVLHFDVSRRKSIAAIEQAMMSDQTVFLVAQKSGDTEDPVIDDLYPIGTVALVKQVLNLPGDIIRVLVEGTVRAELLTITEDTLFLYADIVPKQDQGDTDDAELNALWRSARRLFIDYAAVSLRFSPETLQVIIETDLPGHFADLVTVNVLSHVDERQKILNEISVNKRLETLCEILLKETELAAVEKKVQERVKTQIDKNQKDYYLREQIKAIQLELGDDDPSETEELRLKLQNLPLSEEARTKMEREVKRLMHMAPGTPEITVSRTYIDWIIDLPWGIYSPDTIHIKRARRMLGEDHFGMDEVKERIIEYLAVCKMKKNLKGPILCFVGPPGVGKTSIAKAIARAIGRNFVQMSLGGVRDEAEIRGHRRTYIGSIPGRIISGMKQAGTMNPLFLFDEIDKMGSDFKGDPASAMLEVLDGEQNAVFRDHYLETPFDLSNVMFITTANTREHIPAPLLDRMEIIEVSGYTDYEKLQIAKKHLLPKLITVHGLPVKAVHIKDRMIKQIIEHYTREAGVRALKRELEKIVRKATVYLIEHNQSELWITEDMIQNFLGSPVFLRDKPNAEPVIGVANGLAYTSTGGEMLAVECSVMPGTGVLQLTGQLGDVMKESAQAALSWARAHADSFGIAGDFHKNTDIHIHIPEGAVPKDGPSAGITMTVALLSSLAGSPVRRDVAMTGEITLRGRILPVGGLKEKILAAYRAGIREIILPYDNQKDLSDVPEYV
ncbi:MAG: endopeptidase La, partial [Clostridia bacterium]|nr:endopeptidase La [Clostridia bacterium]